MTRRILPYLLLLATACVKQGAAIREPQPTKIDLFQLCADPRFDCTPIIEPKQDTQPVRVDTNLASRYRLTIAG
jgi:hypothetical protein